MDVCVLKQSGKVSSFIENTTKGFKRQFVDALNSFNANNASSLKANCDFSARSLVISIINTTNINNDESYNQLENNFDVSFLSEIQNDNLV